MRGASPSGQGHRMHGVASRVALPLPPPSFAPCGGTASLSLRGVLDPARKRWAVVPMVGWGCAGALASVVGWGCAGALASGGSLSSMTATSTWTELGSGFRVPLARKHHGIATYIPAPVVAKPLVHTKFVKTTGVRPLFMIWVCPIPSRTTPVPSPRTVTWNLALGRIVS